MTQWYVKELSKLTHISVQTLHHYDRIGLLKPSVRLANGYRLYSEKDLLTLQQIIALKFFGFELAQIKTLLNADVNIIEQFSVQSRFLEEKANRLFDASNALKRILADCSREQSIPWETMIKVIEVYRMTQKLENKWLGDVLSQEELKRYVDFEQELNTRFTASEQKANEEAWAHLVQEIDANLDRDPASEFGIDIGKRCMDWVDNLYSKKHISLRTAIWEKGFKGGHGSQEHGLSPAGVAWLDKAIYAYQIKRIFDVLNMIDTHPHDDVAKRWDVLLTDMYGDEQEPKDGVFQAVMQHEKTSQAVKNWLKKLSNK